MHVVCASSAALKDLASAIARVGTDRGVRVTICQSSKQIAVDHFDPLKPRH
jgi:hypothetical protein